MLKLYYQHLLWFLSWKNAQTVIYMWQSESLVVYSTLCWLLSLRYSSTKMFNCWLFLKYWQLTWKIYRSKKLLVSVLRQQDFCVLMWYSPIIWTFCKRFMIDSKVDSENYKYIWLYSDSKHYLKIVLHYGVVLFIEELSV